LIAADTSTWVAFFQGSIGKDVTVLDDALGDRQVLMIPVVLTELLSENSLPPAVVKTLLELPLLDIELGYWQRAGQLRATVLAKRRKARLGDALIAQSCLDNRVTLLTRDRGFRVFSESASLNLLV
jgi:predicted nucleic acid-binding protein